MLSKKELEELRPWVSESVTAFLGFSEDTVVNAALDCVAKSLSRQATTDHLSPFLDNAAPKFVESLYRKVLEIKSSKLASSNFSVSSAPSKRRKVQEVFGENEEETSAEPVPKKKRVSPISEKNRETRKRLESCWDMDLSWNLYPSVLKEGCWQLGKAMSVPPAAILGGLLILTSFVLSPAVVRVPGTTWVEPTLIWLTISMPTGSRKTTVYQFLRGLLQEIREAAQCSDAHPAWVMQDATFEKMGALMAENGGRLLGMYDELSAFLSKIKLYSNRGLTDSHELAVFLELFNANPWKRTTVTGEANFNMPTTSLTVGGFNQPAVARALIELPGNAEKGLSQRFLWLFPEPVYAEFDSLEPINTDFTDKIVTTLAQVWMKTGLGRCPDKRMFELPQGPQMAKFKAKYDQTQKQLKVIAAMDDLLSGMLSKSSGQILRVSAAIHVLFHLENDEPLPNIIAPSAIEAAIDFVEVCCQHTAYITGRGTIDHELEILEAGSTPITQGLKGGQLHSNEAFLLTLPGKVLDISWLVNKKKKFRSRGGREAAMDAAKQLEKDGMGKLIPKKNKGTVKTWEFQKIDLPENPEEKAAFAIKLHQNYAISLMEYTKNLAAAPDQPRFEAVKDDDGSPPPFPVEDDAGGMDHDHIQELLASTMKQIEERKKQHQSLLAQQQPVPVALLPTPSIPPFSITQTPEYQHNVMSDAIEKARKAAELQARIQNQLLSKPGLLSGLGKPGDKFQAPSKPTPLILDEAGRTVDATGRTIQLSVRQPTLKANIRAQQRASFKQITEKPQKKEEREETTTVYFDSRVTVPSSQRGKKVFKFNDPGKFIIEGQMLRAKAQLEHLQTNIASAARKTGISSATKLALLGPSREGREEDIPLVEWWDAAILPNRSYADFYQQVAPDQKYKDVTNLIEHPPSQQPPGEPIAPPSIPIMLTKKERKKLRQQRRREAEREKQEKIQFGLVDKPEPKVRISNLMRVLGSEAVQDPTKIEAHVRAQMAERQKRHEQANAARKLTPAQRKAKKAKKLKEDLSCGTYVTVYRVRDLSKPAIKFKVDMNAQQYHLTGCVMLYRDVNLVIVEGGPKCLKKFKRLMLHRINWNPDKRGDDDDSDAEDQKEKLNSCNLVWEGKVQDRCFPDWKIKGFPTEGLAREHLKRHSVEHYWDLALSETIVEEED